MSQFNRRILIVVAAAFFVVALAGPSVVSAQMREFGGRIDKISKKKLIVDNRMGDKVSFIRADETVVEGEGKADWKDLKKGNWVRVSWKFVDKPRKAYKVLVTPDQEEAGDDE
jgi:hypothetical protein